MPHRDERAGFTAVVYVLATGCTWRHVPPTFSTSATTAHRRITAWTEASPRRRLHRAVLDELGARGAVGWTPEMATADAGLGASSPGGSAQRRAGRRGPGRHPPSDRRRRH
ncbi:transposase [Streptomyces sp. NPDC050988]|uniref:transposase n=1 Tax=Streptomyces sp. NPDC050988 TaxID=3365637 RepID=UPI0037BD68C5